MHTGTAKNQVHYNNDIVPLSRISTLIFVCTPKNIGTSMLFLLLKTYLCFCFPACLQVSVPCVSSENPIHKKKKKKKKKKKTTKNYIPPSTLLVKHLKRKASTRKSMKMLVRLGPSQSLVNS